jgi:hypothetical protein
MKVCRIPVSCHSAAQLVVGLRAAEAPSDVTNMDKRRQ